MPGLLMAGVQPAPAQTPPSPNQRAIEAAAARLDSLAPLLGRLSARVDSVRAAQLARQKAQGRIQMDTFDVGPFRVAATPGQVELAREVFQGVWADWEPLARGSERVLTPHLFVLLRTTSRGPVFLGDSVQAIRARRTESVETLRGQVRDKVVGIYGRTLPPEVAQWSGGFPRASRAEMAWASRELLSSPSRAARSCYRGEPDWCWEALGFGDRQGALERWYTPEERRHLVGRQPARASGTRRAALRLACIDGGKQGSCDLFLLEVGLPTPLSSDARASFLGHALRRGGEGALERLREGEGRTVRERLLYASGVSADSLVLSWRTELLLARPSAWAGMGRSLVAVLGWILFLAFLATRSTRWRLG